MKNRFMIAVWVFFALTWTVFGLLFLLRLHYWVRGGTCLALGVLSLFTALRARKRAAAAQSAAMTPNAGAQRPPGP
jgi:hypothetical protein